MDNIEYEVRVLEINQYECPYFLFVKVRKGGNNE